MFFNTDKPERIEPPLASADLKDVIVSFIANRKNLSDDEAKQIMSIILLNGQTHLWIRGSKRD